MKKGTVKKWICPMLLLWILSLALLLFLSRAAVRQDYRDYAAYRLQATVSTRMQDFYAFPEDTAQLSRALCEVGAVRETILPIYKGKSPGGMNVGPGVWDEAANALLSADEEFRAALVQGFRGLEEKYRATWQQDLSREGFDRHFTALEEEIKELLQNTR